MAATADYNPCDHGLSAKMWECLRRNHEFRELLVVRTASSGFKALPSATTAPSGTPRWVLEILESASTSSLAAALEDTDWPSLPAATQATLESYLAKKPQVENVGLPSAVGSERAWLNKLRALGKTHRILAVPMSVVHESQRGEVAKAVLARVDPVFSAEQFAKNGAAFGARQQWRHFLLIEKFSAKKGEIDAGAVAIAAVLGQGPERFQDASPSDRDALAEVCRHLSKRGRKNNVRKDYGVIENQIRNSFRNVGMLAQ